MAKTSGVTKWWEKAVVYQLYVRSFADSNGDGKGDVPGIRSRLPYLAELGIDAIWLNPCYPSPQHDHGYDVADFFDIEPDYGTLADFDDLVASAREFGIRILMDVVPNHCSWDHAWFKAALASPPGSPERSRFHFLDGRGDGGNEPPNNWRSIFGGSAWHRVTEPDGSPGQWYLGVFTPQQPDFNWDHPEVGQYFDDMLRFWFDRGVEGFRADAVTVLAKTPGYPDEEVAASGSAEIGGLNPHYTFRPEAHVVWRRWRNVVNQYEADHPGRDLFIVSEAYIPGRPDLLHQYVSDDEFHQAFAFDLMLKPWQAGAVRDAVYYNEEHLVGHGLAPGWTLSNHDAERPATKYGHSDATTWYSGNNLLNSPAPVDPALGARRARALALFTLALPGSVYLYCGDELGLPEVIDLPPEARQDPIWFQTNGRQLGRDGCRVPLPWTTDRHTNFGFSSAADGGSVGATWLPQPDDWGRHAASEQDGDPASMLSLYRTAIAERRARDSFGGVPSKVVMNDDPHLVIVHRGDLLSVLNQSDEPQQLDPALVGNRSVVICSVHDHLDPHTVPANATVWLA